MFECGYELEYCCVVVGVCVGWYGDLGDCYWFFWYCF